MELHIDAFQLIWRFFLVLAMVLTLLGQLAHESKRRAKIATNRIDHPLDIDSSTRSK